MSAIVPKKATQLTQQQLHTLTPVSGLHEPLRTVESELRRHINLLKEELTREQQSRREVSKKLSGLREEYAVLENRVGVVDKLNARVEELENEAQHHKKVINEERLSRSMAEREANEAESQREAAMESCTDLQHQLSNAITLLEQSNQDRERALSEKSMLERQLKSQQEKLKEYSSSNEIVRNEYESLQQELEEVRNALSRNEGEIKRLSSASDTANKSLEDTQQKLKTAVFELSVEKEGKLLRCLY